MTEKFIVGLGHTVHTVHYIRMEFLNNLDNIGIKRRRILRRFQNYKLTLVTKCTLK
jgi:hypothetical protein